MSLNTLELLLLDNLTYLSDTAPFENLMHCKGMTVSNILERIDTSAIEDDFYYGLFMKGCDWKNIVRLALDTPKVAACVVADTHVDNGEGGGKGESVLFINWAEKEAIAAFRGTAPDEWRDDFEGANAVDSKQQINALSWYRNVYTNFCLGNYTVTVTGHSKGGNKAKYIAVLDSSVDRCVSFDGQGFSDKFMLHYNSRILDRSSIIENHNIDYDYVNIILNDIGNKTYYKGFGYGKGGFVEAHCPNRFFNFAEYAESLMEVNPSGQSCEMQVIDRFLNSMIRTLDSDEERDETIFLIGELTEAAANVGITMTAAMFVEKACAIIGSEKYSNNAAYLLAFTIKYAREFPEFGTAVKSVMEHFDMKALLMLISAFDELLGSGAPGVSIDLSKGMMPVIGNIIAKNVSSIINKKTGAKLKTDEVVKVIAVAAQVQKMLPAIKIDPNGDDIVAAD